MSFSLILLCAAISALPACNDISMTEFINHISELHPEIDDLPLNKSTGYLFGVPTPVEAQ
jgi:hypothetical protein